MGTKQIQPKPEPHPYTLLPFVFDPPRKRGEPCRQRDFWHVSPSGDYGQECRLGDAFARELLGLMRERSDWTIARYVLVGMLDSRGGKHNGIEIGFLGVISQVLLHGLTVDTPPQLPPPRIISERQFAELVAAERAAKRAARAAAKRALKANAPGRDQGGRT